MIGWTNNNSMIDSIKYLFFRICMAAKVNYGIAGGAMAAFVIVSLLLSLNTTSLMGIFMKVLFADNNVNVFFIISVYVFFHILNYFLLIYKTKYIKIISYFESAENKKKLGGMKIMMYVFLSFFLFSVSVLIWFQQINLFAPPQWCQNKKFLYLMWKLFDVKIIKFIEDFPDEQSCTVTSTINPKHPSMQHPR